MERAAVRSCRATQLAWLLSLMCVAWTACAAPGQLIVVTGAPGEQEYAAPFAAQCESWFRAGTNGGWEVIMIGRDNASTNDLATLRETITNAVAQSARTLWLVLVGHGTFDGKAAKFNLRGPDLAPADLASWLGNTPAVIINTSSSSSPFLNELSSTNRVVITATRSGNEQNYTRFGKYLAECIANQASDLDKDNQVSLLEAFLMASRKTAEFYKTEGRIQTEHALLDDNSDKLGTPAEWYQGLRPEKKPMDSKAAADGARARQHNLVPSREDAALSPEQTKRRDELEAAVLSLRERKAQMPEGEYYKQLERRLLELARLYR